MMDKWVGTVAINMRMDVANRLGRGWVSFISVISVRGIYDEFIYLF